MDGMGQDDEGDLCGGGVALREPDMNGGTAARDATLPAAVPLSHSGRWRERPRCRPSHPRHPVHPVHPVSCSSAMKLGGALRTQLDLP